MEAVGYPGPNRSWLLLRFTRSMLVISTSASSAVCTRRGERRGSAGQRRLPRGSGYNLSRLRTSRSWDWDVLSVVLADIRHLVRTTVIQTAGQPRRQPQRSFIFIVVLPSLPSSIVIAAIRHGALPERVGRHPPPPTAPLGAAVMSALLSPRWGAGASLLPNSVNGGSHLGFNLQGMENSYMPLGNIQKAPWYARGLSLGPTDKLIDGALWSPWEARQGAPWQRPCPVHASGVSRTCSSHPSPWCPTRSSSCTSVLQSLLCPSLRIRTHPIRSTHSTPAQGSEGLFQLRLHEGDVRGRAPGSELEAGFEPSRKSQQ